MSDQSASLMRRALARIEELQGQLNGFEAAAAEPIAIIGYGCRMPGGIDNPEALWQLLSEGRDAIGDLPPERWDIDAVFNPEPGVPGKMYSRRGGFICDVDKFDPGFFGISPREAARLDPQQRLLLEVSWEALERSGIAPLSLRGSTTGVYIGQATNDYAQLHVTTGDPTLYDTYFATGTAASVASGRLSYTLGLQGPAVTLDTACSSSLVALHLASQALRRGECNLALVGGVNLILSPEAVIAMCQSRMMAPDGVCKTFDASADGFGQAEGCVVIVVKRLSDAVRDGDNVLALIRGSAINQDGSSSGLTAPNGPSQTAVIRAAFQNARLSPADCSYVEAHGTGTSLGDPIEIQALDAAFGAGRSSDQPLWTGSIKTNLGHLEAAAGLAGLLKVALSLQHREIPAHLHFNTPNPLIPWNDIKVRVANQPIPFPQINGRRVAGLSSFGFSGTNAHIVLEEAPAPIAQQRAPERPVELLTLSAKGTAAQRELVKAFRSLLNEEPALSLSDLASSANIGRSPSTHRLTLTASGVEEAKNQLDLFLAGEPASGLASAVLESADPPRIAFLFTGQGAQYPDMGRSLYNGEPVFRAAFDDCDGRFSQYLPASIAQMVYGSADSAVLGQTQWTQPALFAIEWALAQLWRSWGVEPGLVIGHSIGEYVAACLAGVFSLDDAVKLVAARATLMGGLPAGGAMTAVMVDEADLTPVLVGLDQVSVAAVNGPRSIVLSGPRSAVDEAEHRLAARDIGFTRLDVSHAFHSSLLDPVLDEFEAVANGIAMSDPVITLVSNLTGQPARRGDVTKAEYWRDQTRGTVRFADGLKAAYKLGYRVFIEIGPRPTLTNLAQRTLADDSVCLATLDGSPDASRAALETLGRVYLKGATIDWKGVHGPGRTRVLLPTYPFQRSRHWLEAQAPAVRPAMPVAGAGHPHLTRRTDSALGETIFDMELELGRYPYLADHIVHGAAIVPTAFYLDAIASAVAAMHGSTTATLEDIVIHRPVTIPAEGRDLQLVFKPRGATDRFELYSRESEGWSLAVSGSFAQTSLALPSETDGTLDAGGLQTIAIDRFYVALDRIGLAFGPSFHRLAALRRRDGAAEAEVSAPSQRGFGIHPAMLDGCLQTLAAALPGFDPESIETDVYMPIAIDRFELFQPANGALYAIGRYDGEIDGSGAKPPEIRVGHVSVRSLDGAPVGRITGVRMKRAVAKVSSSAVADDTLYRVEWCEMGSAHRTSDASLLADFDGSSVAAILEEDFVRLSEAHELAGLAELDPLLDAVCAAYVGDALAGFGWCGAPGTVLVFDDLLHQVVPHHHRLLARMLAMLVEDNVLAEEADGRWRVLRDTTSPTKPDIASLIDRFPQFRAEILFAERGGAQLGAALRGHVDAAEVLFPAGSFELADELYRRSPAAHAFNALAARAVAEALRSVPSGRRLRILEIGGGTGGVTSAILPILPADTVSYLFTDISPAFLQKAQSDFSTYPFLDFECLDIEKSPGDQGFKTNHFDLIVASNVLHATDNLAVTIEHAGSLLAPGGQLLILEGLKPVRWIDLSFGLTEGWWKFSDTVLRPDYPLMGADAWRSLLAEKGFCEPLIAPNATSNAWVGQGMILAKIDTAKAVAASARPLIFADQAGASDRLVAKLRAHGFAPSIVQAGDHWSGEEDGSFVIDPQETDHYVHILASLAARDALPDTIAFLWPIDAELASDASPDELTEQLDRCCGSLLRLLQAYGATAKGAPLTLWIVTRRAQSVLATDRLEGMVQSACLGLAKVAALEFPEIACHRLDLDQLGDIDLVADGMGRPGDEPVMAIRQGRRYAARLSRAVLPEQSLGKGRTLHIVDRGSFEGLALRPLARAPLADKDVEIRVAASGLNFRDVLNVIGARDDDAPFGGEVSGIVTRIGDSVEGLGVGQAVVSVTYGGHGDFAVAPAALTLPRPANLDWAQAAGSTLAFLTAYYALTVIGKAKPGERVLVHAAAGGVGMAAVLLAQRAGLEVFATAGSQSKRDVLISMGIKNVYDSRSLDFADEISRDTKSEGVDIVLAAVTGPAIAAGLRLLREGGRYLEIGKAEILSGDEARGLNGLASYHALDLAELIVRAPQDVRPWFVEICDRLACAELDPIPTQSFPLEDAGAAFEHMARARHVGKVVLEVDSQPSASPHAAGRPLTIEPDATYLVSGGLTGLGLASAERLVDRGARHLLLFGRRAPSALARRAIDQMRDRGAQIVVASADAGNDTEMRALFDGPLSAMPPLRGVIHSAGRLEDATVPQQNWSRFLDVLGPKAIGGWLLHQLTRDKPLDFFVLYSSASAILGAPGQSNHASANAFLDALAAYRQGQGAPALSINWGAWSDIGAAAGQHTLERLGGQGVAPITVAEGLAALERLLGQPEPQVAVVRADWNRVGDFVGNALERRFLGDLTTKTQPATIDKRASEFAANDIMSAPADKRRDLLTKLVKEQVAQVLGVPETAIISEIQPFRDMGLDSLMALELRTRLKKGLALETPLPATMAFDHPTVRALITYLMSDVLGFETAEQTAATASPDRGVIDQIEQMSDDEIDRILKQRRAGVS